MILSFPFDQGGKPGRDAGRDYFPGGGGGIIFNGPDFQPAGGLIPDNIPGPDITVPGLPDTAGVDEIFSVFLDWHDRLIQCLVTYPAFLIIQQPELMGMAHKTERLFHFRKSLPQLILSRLVQVEPVGIRRKPVDEKTP
jgi:hypothetical protein